MPSAIWAGDSARSQAAASSTAKGMPSSRWHTVRTADSLSASMANPGRTWAPRSANSEMASSSTMDGTRHTVSPATPSGSRVVARTDTSGHERSRASASSAPASRRCSQLSRQTSRRRSRRCRVSARSGPPTGSTMTLVAAAASSATSVGSVTGPRSTHHTPSGHRSASRAAAWTARRVLPHPPEPVTVTIRSMPSSRSTAASSWLRPTKLVSWGGRLLASTSRERSGGKSSGSSACRSSKMRSGADRSRSRWLPRSRSQAPPGTASPTIEAVTAVSNVWPAWATSRSRAPRCSTDCA
jgi:hypothetical protein